MGPVHQRVPVCASRGFAQRSLQPGRQPALKRHLPPSPGPAASQTAASPPRTPRGSSANSDPNRAELWDHHIRLRTEASPYRKSPGLGSRSASRGRGPASQWALSTSGFRHRVVCDVQGRGVEEGTGLQRDRPPSRSGGGGRTAGWFTSRTVSWRQGSGGPRGGGRVPPVLAAGPGAPLGPPGPGAARPGGAGGGVARACAPLPTGPELVGDGPGPRGRPGGCLASSSSFWLWVRESGL